MKIVENLDLSNYNSYKIKSIAKKAYFPHSIDEFIELFHRPDGEKKILIGGGYNIILSKERYEDISFVILKDNLSKIEINGSEIYAEAGAFMKTISGLALENSLSGLEYFYDIPSSLGGALVMNAGSKGEDISSLVKELRYFDTEDLEVKTVLGSNLNSSYRYSIFQDKPNYVVLDATLILKNGNQQDIEKKMKDNLEARQSKQPKNFPNAGSVFKRPKGYFVGELIEKLGLKGKKIGGAMISEKHAGFIINYDNATGQNIIDLIKFIQTEVKNEFGVNLEVEQRII